MGFLWLDSFVVALQITANSNRRRNAIMQTCPAEIQLTRPPAPGHERAQAGPEPERHPGARPGPAGSPLPPKPGKLSLIPLSTYHKILIYLSLIDL